MVNLKQCESINITIDKKSLNAKGLRCISHLWSFNKSPAPTILGQVFFPNNCSRALLLWTSTFRWVPLTFLRSFRFCRFLPLTSHAISLPNYIILYMRLTPVPVYPFLLHKPLDSPITQYFFLLLAHLCFSHVQVIHQSMLTSRAFHCLHPIPMVFNFALCTQTSDNLPLTHRINHCQQG